MRLTIKHLLRIYTIGHKVGILACLVLISARFPDSLAQGNDVTNCVYQPSYDSVDWKKVEPGIYYAVYSHKGSRRPRILNVYVHLLKVDLGNGELILRSLRPIGGRLRIEQIVKLFRNSGVDIRAAVNGDYFHFGAGAKDPLGLHVSGGQLLRFPRNTTSVVTDTKGMVYMDKYEVKQTVIFADAVLEVDGANRKPERDEAVLYSGYYQSVPPATSGCTAALLSREKLELMVGHTILLHVEKVGKARHQVRLKPLQFLLVGCGKKRGFIRELRPKSEVRIKTEVSPPVEILEAISGGPRILRAGKVVQEIGRESFPLHLAWYIPRRHPRTAVGIDKTGKLVFLLVAEGRTIKRSSGLTATDAACILKGIGAWDAMLFDGGGSAVLMVGDRFMNKPHRSRNFTYRDLANILAVIRIRK